MNEMQCPFCAQKNDKQVLVCRVCHRDIYIPMSLKAEHQELTLRRDRLRAELGDVKARLGASRSWPGFWVNKTPED
jgi:hypothetical protein